MIAPVSFNSLAFYFLIVCDVIVDGGCGVNDFEVFFFFYQFGKEKKKQYFTHAIIVALTIRALAG